MKYKKTRTNKMNLVVNWPKNTFTIEELHDQNSEFKNITLRVRLKNAIDENKVQEIAYIHNGKGRPRTLFACNPITEDHICEASDRNAKTKDGFSFKVTDVQKNQLEALKTNITINTAKPEPSPSRMSTFDEIINRLNQKSAKC
jgi:hypothetical protein